MKLFHGTEESIVDNEGINDFISAFADRHLTFSTTSFDVAKSYTVKNNGIVNIFEFEAEFKNALTIDCKGHIWDSEELMDIVEKKTGEECFTEPDDLSHLLSKYDAIIFENISDIGNRVFEGEYVATTVMLNNNSNIKFQNAYNV